MQKKNYEELVARLVEIKDMGYVQSHRSGDTGIGKTLEDLLGIPENNVPGPDGKKVELKSARKSTGSMLTFLTKQPLPPKIAISSLLEKFGYPSPKNGRKILHSTIRTKDFNTIKGKKALKVNVNENVELISFDGELMGYWTMSLLKEAFEKKFPALLYVKADSKGKRSNEEFWFNEAWYLKGFNFESFKELIKNRTICVDLRIGQYPNGNSHDHGTGFRIRRNKRDLCFLSRERIM